MSHTHQSTYRALRLAVRDISRAISPPQMQNDSSIEHLSIEHLSIETHTHHHASRIHIRTVWMSEGAVEGCSLAMKR